MTLLDSFIDENSMLYALYECEERFKITIEDIDSGNFLTPTFINTEEQARIIFNKAKNTARITQNSSSIKTKVSI